MSGNQLSRRLVLVFFCGLYSLSAFSAEESARAVSGIVSGNVQKVGFRALLFKQAIQYNLAGTAQNLTNGTVKFLLQGDAGRIEKTLEVLDKGTRKSSDVKIETFPATVNPNLKTFTVIGWTSASRQIAASYDLVFTLRPDGESVSEKEAVKTYRRILGETLLPADLEKLNGEED